VADDPRFVMVNSSNYAGQVKEAKGLVIVDLWAEWCAPCRAIAPKLAELKDEYGDRLVVAKVNVDESPDIAAEHRVASIPTLLFFKGGQVVDSLVGNRPTEKIREKIDKYV
jgi:thioredoxin 1